MQPKKLKRTLSFQDYISKEMRGADKYFFSLKHEIKTDDPANNIYVSIHSKEERGADLY